MSEIFVSHHFPGSFIHARGETQHFLSMLTRKGLSSSLLQCCIVCLALRTALIKIGIFGSASLC